MSTWQVGAITLPGDLEWTDELTWSPLRQSESTGLTGATIVQSAQQTVGRPITLTTPRDVWVTRGQIKALLDLAADPETSTFALVHPDGREFTVAFRHDGGAAPVDTAPIMFRSPPIDTDPHTLTLKLMTA